MIDIKLFNIWCLIINDEILLKLLVGVEMDGSNSWCIDGEECMGWREIGLVIHVSHTRTDQKGWIAAMMGLFSSYSFPVSFHFLCMLLWIIYCMHDMVGICSRSNLSASGLKFLRLENWQHLHTCELKSEWKLHCFGFFMNKHIKWLNWQKLMMLLGIYQETTWQGNFQNFS